MALKKSSSSGIYSAEFRRKSLKGERLSLSLRTRSKAEANRRHAQLKQLLDANRVDILERLRSGELSILDVDRALALSGKGLSALEASHEGISLGRARELLRVHFALERLRPSTRASNEQAMNALIARFGEDAILADLSEGELRRWFAALPLAMSTLKLRLDIYRRLWRLALETERLEASAAGMNPRLVDNPWAKIKLAKDTEEEVSAKLILTPQEALALLDANLGTPECALMALAYLAGLRQQEAAHLRREDVDLERGFLDICIHKNPHPWKPKAKRSIRKIPIGEDLQSILSAHLVRGFASRVYLFSADGSRPLSRYTARDWWRRAYKRAGIVPGRGESGIVYHTGRHSFATWALSSGEAPTRVAEYLGHTVDELLKTYAHCLPKETARVRDAVQGVLSGAKSSKISSSGEFGREKIKLLGAS